MDEIALNILDIAYNSIRANASHIKIMIIDSIKDNIIDIYIEDDGSGMSEQQVQEAIDPFYTTRTTRKVGLGLSLLKEGCEMTGGSFEVSSIEGIGTKVKAVFIKDHIDTPVIGNIEETMMTLIQANENIEYQFIYKDDKHEFKLDTIEIKEILGNVSINEPDVLIWLKEYIKEGLGR